MKNESEKGRKMSEKPVLFNDEMVRAILAGRKTQTRRPIKPQPQVVHRIHNDASIETNRLFPRGDQRIHCPYGEPGDRLWVREAWHLCPWKDKERYCYRAEKCGTEPAKKTKWSPSIHMPHWVSRITLEVVSVRVERVRWITELGARTEGIGLFIPLETPATGWDCLSPLRSGFAMIWDEIYKAKGYGWEADPWVWVVEFRRVAK